MAKIMQCALYIRVSTEEQANKEHSSLDAQESLLQSEVVRRDKLAGDLRMDQEWRVEKVYRDVVSAKDTKRPAFQEMTKDIREGRVNMVLAIRLDRLFRRTLDFLEFASFCAEHDAGFLVLRESIDMSTPQGKLMATLYAALAEFEREQIGQRVRAKQAWQAGQGLFNGGRVLGYDPSPDHKGRLTVNPEESALVRLIFETYLKCGSLLQTAHLINEKGYRTKQYLSRRGKARGGFTFGNTQVAQVLRDPLYVGKIQYKGTLHDGKHEPIVPRTLWVAVQSKIDAHAPTRRNVERPKRYAFFLEGLVRCGACSSYMTPKYCTGRNGLHYYYQCTRQTHNGKAACTMKYVSAPELDGAIIGRVKEIGRDRRYVDHVAGTASQNALVHGRQLMDRRKTLEAHLNQSNRKISAWGETLAATEDAGTRKEVLRLIGQEGERKKALEAERAHVEHELEAVRAQTADAGKMQRLLASFSELFDKATEQERKWLVRLIVHKVIWTPEEVRYALYPHPDTTALPVKETAMTREDDANARKGGGNGALEVSEWLAGLDSNQEWRNQNPLCYQLHHRPSARIVSRERRGHRVGDELAAARQAKAAVRPLDRAGDLRQRRAVAAAEVDAELALEGRDVDADVLPQPQEDRLEQALVARQLLHARRRAVAAEVALDVRRVGPAPVRHVRVRAGTEAQVRPALPAPAVVRRLEPRPREVGDLVVPVARRGQDVHRPLHVAGLRVVVGQDEPALHRALQAGAGLHRQTVERHVLGVPGDDLAQVRRKVLAGHAEDDVDDDVAEAGVARRLKCRPRLRRVVRAAEELQRGVVETLHAQREAVDARVAVGPQVRDALGIRLQRDLQRLDGFEEPPRRRDQRRDGVGPEHRRRAAAEVQGRKRRAGLRLHVARDGVNEARVDGALDEDEMTVRTSLGAEGDVNVQAVHLEGVRDQGTGFSVMKLAPGP